MMEVFEYPTSNTIIVENPSLVTRVDYLLIKIIIHI